MSTTRKWFIWIAALTLALFSLRAQAGERVDIIVTVSAGGAPDLVARVVADILRDSDYEVTVRNIPGANGEIALRTLQQAPPSRLTLLVAANSLLFINPHLYNRPPGEGEWSGTQPVMYLGKNTSNFIVTRADTPFQSLDELAQARRAQGHPVRYATNGVGSIYHLAFEEMLTRTGTSPRVHVPFKSNSEVVQALVSGDVDVGISGTSALPLLEARRLKAIGVLSNQPSPLFPDAVPVSRRGTDMPLMPWFSLLANRSISSAKLQDIRDKLQIGLRAENQREKLRTHGILTEELSAKQLASRWDKDFSYFRAAIKKLRLDKASE